MSIKYAILGYLSWQPYSGYDLKKIFEDSAVFHWSGNNNQIYKALVELHEQGMVTLEVQQQADHPPRKIYTITESGRAELRQWLLTAPELPQIRNTFLVQLAWADQLPAGELDDLLNGYEEEVRLHRLMLDEQRKRGKAAPQRTAREILLWNAILQNRILLYDSELRWVSQLRDELKAL
jgi:PadR family transcriptional regulator, regulatory protein AphA